MTRALYVIGEPGVGKSTAFRLLTEHLPLGKPESVSDESPLLKVQRWDSGLVLGFDTGEGFPGTDRLSMAVQPHAMRWVTESDLPKYVIGEGQRLANVAFLMALAARSDLRVVHIRLDEAVAQSRRTKRGTGQNEKWAKAARSRAYNLAENLIENGVNVTNISGAFNPDQIAHLLNKELSWQ